MNDGSLFYCYLDILIFCFGAITITGLNINLVFCYHTTGQ